MDNDFAEDNEDDVINILQNVKVEMEHDDDDDGDNDAGCEDNSNFVWVKEEKEDDDDDNDDAGSKDNSSFVCLEDEKEEENYDVDKESISSGEDGDSGQDSTSTSTHIPFEQVFLKEEHDSNSMDETYTEPLR
ncbi:prostatic spermine-binding protein isoform X2 [Nilaparvata lugens]|uniref:prostatic spermine-binding protein isoform X2 n=1 Tax=Nilaparvata lugens TaxID=108931 RepID=UPI00193DD9D0|nr:prostatic spermine-binding protein isoform X2 [Nilaparvata lugens]